MKPISSPPQSRRGSVEKRGKSSLSRSPSFISMGLRHNSMKDPRYPHHLLRPEWLRHNGRPLSGYLKRLDAHIEWRKTCYVSAFRIPVLHEAGPAEVSGDQRCVRCNQQLVFSNPGPVRLVDPGETLPVGTRIFEWQSGRYVSDRVWEIASSLPDRYVDCDFAIGNL